MVLYFYTVARNVDGTDREYAEVQYVMDNAISVIWRKSYAEPGYFEVYAQLTDELYSLLTTNLGRVFVLKEADPTPMYAENVQIIESAEGKFVTVSGRSADCLLAYRVIGYPTVFKGQIMYAIIWKLIKDNATAPTVPAGSTDPYADTRNRRLRMFSTGDEVIEAGRVTNHFFDGENLLEVVDRFLLEMDCGLKCTAKTSDDTPAGIDFVLHLYKGQDRPNVVFSADNEMLLSYELISDRSGKNLIFASATGPDSETQANGSNPYTLTAQSYFGTSVPNGLARSEGSVKVSGVPTEESTSVDLMDYTWEQGSYYFPDGEEVASTFAIRSPIYIPCSRRISVTATLDGDPSTRFSVNFYDSDYNHLSGASASSGGTVTLPANTSYVRLALNLNTYRDVTPEDLSAAAAVTVNPRSISGYRSDVAARGTSGITPSLRILKAQITDTGLFRAGVDYDLGDTVYLETARGVRGSATITAITEVEDAEGYRIFPTFSDWTTL